MYTESSFYINVERTLTYYLHMHFFKKTYDISKQKNQNLQK